MQKYLYHSTFMLNLKSIFKYGLNPLKILKKNYSISKDNVIYLSDNLNDAQHYCIIKQYSKNESPNTIITLVIDISKLDILLLELDVKHKGENTWRYNHYMYNGIIPISAIIDIKTYFHNNKINLNIIKLAKQVGILYHYTKIRNLHYILTSNMLLTSKWQYIEQNNSLFNKSYNNSPKLGQVVCFTRNSNFHNISQLGILSCRIVIDGDKLSNSYKIKPIRDIAHLGIVKHISDESLLICMNNIKNLKNYIIRIDIDYNLSLFLIYTKYVLDRKMPFDIGYRITKRILDKTQNLINSYGISYKYVDFGLKSSQYRTNKIDYRTFLKNIQSLN